MQSESTVTGRRLRNLGLSVFNPDNSSDDDAVPVQRSTPQTTAQLLPKPLPVPGVSQNSYFPQPSPLQQQLQSPYTARAVGRQPSHPIHSASSSTSSISISTSLSSQPGFQFPNGARQIGAQSSPTSRYANASPLNYVGSSSSSRSSPAMDTTPPPATPSNNLPPVNFVGGITDDRNLDGLGLDVASETYYPPASSSNQSRHDVRNGLYPEHVQSTQQHPQVVNPSPAPTPPAFDRRESVEKLIITVTADAENHVIVDITGAMDAAVIRERMLSKLRIPDDERENYQIYRTELGEAALGAPVSDNDLMVYCGQWADAKGTLKFLVQRNPAAPPPQPQPQPQFTAPPQPQVQTPPALANPVPPMFSPAYERWSRENMAGPASSVDRDRDRPRWDMSNGYDGDVDGSNRRRHQSPAPIDTTRRRREPSASGSDFSSFSPTSPGASSITPMIGVPTRRPQPSQLSTVTGPFLNPNSSVPVVPGSHRRRESDTAAMEREQAMEAHERYREAQSKEYDSAFKKGRAEKDRQARRQQQIHGNESGHRAHRSESADAPHGWVLVNEVPPSATSANGPGGYTGTGHRNPAYGRSNTTGGVNEWTGSPPSDSHFSPSTPSMNRPYPHSTNTSTTPTLQRSHPPLPAAVKYPNPHPHPRTGLGTHAQLPPGAIDPRMRQIERQQQQPAITPSQFYSPSIAASYNPSPVGYNVQQQQVTPPSSRMLQPSVNVNTTDLEPGATRLLRSPRSMSDLNQRNAISNVVSPPTSHSTNQIPTLTNRKPNALPTSSLLSDSMYNPSRPPTSPNRLPPSPSRPIINPTLLYNGNSSANARTPATPMDHGNGLPRSLGSGGASLFSSGVFADGPLTRNPAIRPKPSSDRLNALDRTMAAHAQTPNRDQGPPLQRPPIPTPGASTSYRDGWLSNTTSPTPSRPNSGDVDSGDFNNRPSPIEQSFTDAFSRLEIRRPSLPMVNVVSTPHEVMSERQPSPYAEVPPSNPAIQIQIPKAVVTPSSPINPSPGTNPVGVQLYDNPSPVITTAASPAMSTLSSTEFTDDGSEGTLKPGDRERLLSMAGSDNDADEEGSGTMKPRITQVTFSQASPTVIRGKAKRVSLQTAAAKAVSFSAPRQTDDSQRDGEDEDEVYYDSDSSEEDMRFWNNASSTSSTITPTIKTSAPDDDGSSTLGPMTRGRGPSLTLTISPLVDDRGSPMPTPSTAITDLPTSRENSPSPSPAAGLTPTSASGINRRASFRRDTWAFRPIQEDVLDHLQDFFPDHDLDKPFIDQVQIANEGLPSPAGEHLPPPPPPASKEGKSRHRKSIRFVAEERKKVLERVGSAREPSAKAANLGRKRSTKLWGIKVEEVTPGQVKSGMPPTIPESPTGPAPRPTIKWVKGELIGKGTYGRVFLALNVTTGEMMAVKQVEMPQTISDQDDARQAGFVKALESEQQTLEKLDHPNIVQYLGFEKTAEFFSVFLEYVPGGSIGSCLRREGKFNENIIKSFTGQIIDGLAYLHYNKIIHRDIKADNILVDPQGNCKISDFGVSKQTAEEIYNNAAMTVMQGSLFWMAPEMFQTDKKGYNAKIDIWSLGCVFIEMFAGRRPWEQEHFVSVMLKVGAQKLAPPVPSDVHLSQEAEDFRLKCFCQDPDLRPTAEALKSHPWLILPHGWFFTGAFK